jgi:multidrug efflux pump subunit AcrA (membrane-fusion protein)
MSEEKKSLFRSKKIWIFFGILLIAIVAVAIKLNQPKIPEFSSVSVEQIDLVQSVSETGAVVADLEIMYGWEISGRVVSVEKTVGDEVKKGDVIATVNVLKERARYTEALAALSAARAKLQLEVVGPSDEEKNKSVAAVAQANAALDQSKADKEKTQVNGEKSISNAEKAVDTAQNNLQFVSGGENSQIVEDAYADLVNILKSALTSISEGLSESDAILGIDNTLANDDFEDFLSIGNKNFLSQASTNYLTVKRVKEHIQFDIVSLSEREEHDTIDTLAVELENVVSEMQVLLFSIQQVLDATRPLSDFSQADLDALRSGIHTSKTNIDSAANAITNGKQAITTGRNSLSSYTIVYDTAVLDLENTKKQATADMTIASAKVSAQEANVAQAKAAHALLIAPPRNVDVASLRADISRQSANVAALESDVTKGSLVALSDGVISTLDVEIGENVNANATIVSIISPELNIEVDVSESDIAKVHIDDIVDVTLDAFGDDDIFAGSVVSIEPAETEVSGVIYYKTKILLDNFERMDIRPGMTANVTVITHRVDGAIVVPQRAILEKNGGDKIVRLLTDSTLGTYTEVPVTIGMRGDDGFTQILSGLSVGQEVVTFIKEE